MDGIKKRETQLKQVETESETRAHRTMGEARPRKLGGKFATLISLLSLLTFMLPHQTFAAVVPEKETSTGLVFVIGGRIAHLDILNDLRIQKLFERKQMQEDLDRQLELNKKVRDYLQEQNSPLAAYTSTLLQLSNWKKIVALSNAESGMCRHYPVNKANCWGIGGSNLWYMGSNLGEGIISMNHFLNNYPNNSKVKYAQMTFNQMNGLYKQPPGQHWVINNQVIYDKLTAIENSL